MFFIRAAFWLSVVVMLLPADNSTGSAEPEGPAGVSAMAAIGAARAALEDISGICARRPAVCETSTAALHAIGRKAKYGARTLYEYLDENMGEDGPDAVSSRSG